MEPLDAREWLEGQRLAGNPFALELLDLVDSAPEADENALAIEDLRKSAPSTIPAGADGLWRLVEWYTDKLALLDELGEIVEQYQEPSIWPNGVVPVDLDDRLRDMFESSRWLLYDL